MRKFCVVLLLALMVAAPAWGAAFSGDDYGKVAFDSVNKRYMRVYRQTSTGPSSTIRAMIFNADGSVYSDNPIRSSVVCDRPAVAFDATSSQFLVVWSEGASGNVDIYGQLVSATGANSGALISFTADVGNQVEPSVACDSNGRFFVVWTDVNGDVDIKGKFMAVGGAPDASTTTVCDDGYAQEFPDVAFSPALGRFMVVWKDSRMGNADVWGALFNGTLRISKFKVSRNSDTFDQDSPRVACTATGDSFLVCFRDAYTNSIVGQMVTGSGSGILNGPSIAISAVGQSADDDSALSVAFGTDRYLVTWIDMRNSGSNANDIYGQYLTAAGQPIEANFAVNTEAVDQFNPYVAGNSADGSFLAGWGYKTGTTVYHFNSTILNAPATPGGSSGGGGGGGGCFISSVGGGWQVLAWALSGLLAAVGIRRR